MLSWRVTSTQAHTRAETPYSLATTGVPTSEHQALGYAGSSLHSEMKHACRWNNLGYIASLITFCGATIFWVSTITGVPGVMPDESTHIAEWDVLFWLPQVGQLHA